jgi:hypothetical protein
MSPVGRRVEQPLGTAEPGAPPPDRRRRHRPRRDALIRLVGAVLAEQYGEWAEMRRYIGLDILAKSRADGTAAKTPEEVTLTAITA